METEAIIIKTEVKEEITSIETNEEARTTIGCACHAPEERVPEKYSSTKRKSEKRERKPKNPNLSDTKEKTSEKTEASTSEDMLELSDLPEDGDRKFTPKMRILRYL